MEETDSSQRGGVEGDNSEKKGKNLFKECMNDPWKWTMVLGLTVGLGGWAGWKRAKGKIGTTVIE